MFNMLPQQEKKEKNWEDNEDNWRQNVENYN